MLTQTASAAIVAEHFRRKLDRKSGPINITLSEHGRYFRFRFYSSITLAHHTEMIYSMDEDAARVAAWYALAFHFNRPLHEVKHAFRIQSIAIGHTLEEVKK